MAQAQLLPRHTPIRIPADQRDYVVALQAHSGELDALRHVPAPAWEHLTPLIGILSGRRDPEPPLRRDTVRGWIKRLGDSVGPSTFYLDLLRPRPLFPTLVAGKQRPVLNEIYNAARRRELNFIPVVWAGESNQTHTNLVADAAFEDGRGVGIRYRFRTVMAAAGRRAQLKQLLDELGQQPEEADLLLDAGWIDPDDELAADDVAAVIREFVKFGDWRSLAFLGSSVPLEMGCIEEGTVDSLARREWDLWMKLRDLELPRLPVFGDYAVQSPFLSSGGGPGMRRNIRYTAARQMVVARGKGDLTDESDEQYRHLCKQIIGRREFCGASYSWGDETIAGCAGGTVRPRRQRMWRGAGTSHHIQFVINQLRALAMNS